ncbi:MAG: magnesium-translocating P-type ATPase [archaeon]
MHKKEGAALWALSIKELLEHFKTSERGLSSSEALERQKSYGTNELLHKDKKHGLGIFLAQFKNPLVSVLVGASIITAFLGNTLEALVILGIVLLNAILGFIQEYKAEKTLRELKRYIMVEGKVLRDGEIVKVDAKDLVPGDIVHLNIGDIIPADVRLIHVDDMTTDESSLTGESLPVIKRITVVSEARSLPQYLHNIAFSETTVASGSGFGVVIATGEKTFFGRIAAHLKQKEPESEFQRSIREFGNFTLKIILAMTVFIFLANALLGKGVLDSFLFAIALAVGITPEVLPIIMTITLSSGALKMSKQKVVVKSLGAVEDLGNIDTLCCDKTGTLTEGALSLHEYADLDGKKDDKLVLYGLLCNSARGTAEGRNFSNPIDKAIWESDKVKALEPLILKYAILDENDFDFERMRMSVNVSFSHDKRSLLIAKGAPESILKVCGFAVIKGKKRRLNKAVRQSIEKRIIDYEEHGYRVIAVAEKSTKKKEADKYQEHDMTMLGFLLFLDPPKESARETLALMKSLSINIKIMTGDSPVITRKICTDVGLEIINGRIITGDELDKLDPAEFYSYANKFNVFARVTPEQKHNIVKSLTEAGRIVGFLGDGINDAPALKAADVGITVDSAAGIAKDASDIILLRKSLNVLADGIKEGRKTFGNINKYIMNTVSANYGNMITVAASSLFLKFIPMLPSQILLNNFISDIPQLTIATDNVDSYFLRKPKKWDIKMISKFMIFFGLISTFFDLALIAFLLLIFKAPPELFRTAWFVESSISEIIVTFAIRSRMPFYKSRPSKWLILSSVLCIALVFGMTYLTVGRAVFEFIAMPWAIVSLVVGVLVTYFITAEIAKRYFFKKFEL